MCGTPSGTLCVDRQRGRLRKEVGRERPFFLAGIFMGFPVGGVQPGTQLERSLELLLNGPEIYGTGTAILSGHR